MRILAAYSFETTPTGGTAVLAQQIDDQIAAWLAAKVRPDGDRLVLSGGRTGELTRNQLTTSKGMLAELTLSEPSGGGLFQTTLAVARDDTQVAVSCELSAGTQQLTPLRLDVRCPRVIKDILGLINDWSYANTRLQRQVLAFSGAAGGNDFIDLVWNEQRSLPVIAVSEQYGLVLHPGVAEALALDVAGLALVARLDHDASWRLTQRKDRSWSCYGGAIRVFWPGVRDGGDSQAHPLWTAQRLISGLTDTEAAAERIRGLLRRRVLTQSSFAVTPPKLLATIRRAVREDDLAALHARIQDGADYEALAEEYFQKLHELTTTLAARDEEIDSLRARVSSLQVALRYTAPDAEDEAVTPSPEPPPTTAEDAYLMAMERSSANITFGADVERGLRTLADDAGPPEKILDYLMVLSELAVARRAGGLGKSLLQWLADRGVICSGESPTVRNSVDEMRARTWDDGAGGRREFELHLKPSDGTSPDRCVRIYFDHDDGAQKVVVGWIGRHP